MNKGMIIVMANYGFLQSSRLPCQKLTGRASHTTEHTGHVLGGSQRDGLS